MSSSPFIRSFPHLEDDGAIAGGDSTALQRGMAKVPPFAGSWREPASPPPGNDGLLAANGLDLENEADEYAQKLGGAFDDDPLPEIDFLALVREAENQSSRYSAQVNRRAWTQTLRAYHNEHFAGSKYTRPDWRGRSKLFVPKTRAAVRKDNAAVAASLFNNIDAINCLPGNEGDPVQRASAKLMEALVNYRTDRTSGKAALPWFLVSMGARQDAVLTGVCCTKQCWKQEFRKVGEEPVFEPDEDGVYVQKMREKYALDIDRPDMLLIPPENFEIDPSAPWTNPAQGAAFFLIKWPMQLEEIRGKMDAPVNPWKDVPDEVLKTASENGNTAAIRRAREMGLDRLDETQTGNQFQIIWVYESFMRIDGEDYTFYSIGDQHYLTDPKPVREVYPAHYGERPLALGYGSLESHRIYPMAPAESWQPLQHEVNDLRNLRLDATKQNVMPISKVRRGRQVDLDQVRRRSSGSAIIVQEPDDVTWETPPQIPPSVVEMSRELDLEFDDLSGQQNFGSVQTNNALGKTLGGLKLAAGAANSVQEFDIRVWIETWAAPALAQIVQLEQYYESDPVVLGLCGEKAQLRQKHGIDQITDALLEAQVTVRVSVGLGAGDPMLRLQKFQSAAAIVAPLLAQTQEFQSGKKEIDWEAICEEVFGSAGYRDGGKRFFRDGQQKQDPLGDLKIQELKAKIAKDERTGQGALFGGLASLAKVALGKRELEAEVVDRLLGRQIDSHSMGFDHAHRHADQHLSATEHGHRHGLAIAGHRHQVGQDEKAALQQAEEVAAGEAAGTEKTGATAPGGAPDEPQAQSPAASSSTLGPEHLMQLLMEGKIEFTRKGGRISGLKLAGGAPKRPAAPAKRPQPAA